MDDAVKGDFYTQTDGDIIEALRKENEELNRHIKRYLYQLKWFMENHPKIYKNMIYEALTPPQERISKDENGCDRN